MRFGLGLAALGAAMLLVAQDVTFEGAPAIALGNDRVQVTILPQGSSIASIVLTNDPRKINPLWNPMRMAREAGEKGTFDAGTGSFLCLDGFGSPSQEERTAGLPTHGEAHYAQWETRYSGKQGSTAALTLAATLPIVQERVERTFRMVDGEPVVYVETQVESLLGFDRPMIWAEHATVGSPFLEPGVTLIEMSATQSRTRSYGASDGGGLPNRFAKGKDFKWPWAPGKDGRRVDMRTTPASPNSGGHTTSLMDRNRKLAFLTMFNPKMGLLLGYLFRSEQFPWVQSWEDYPPSKRLARGLEFSTQPFDVPRREAIQMNTLFNTPTYRWLPAKSKVTSRFLMFYTKVPNGFKKVDDVRMEGASIVVEDRGAKQKITLAASLPL
jgi:hypothetical protein